MSGWWGLGDLMATFGLSVLASAVLVGLVRWDAVRRGLLDVPNARSSHQLATPRGGGLGLLLALAIAVTFGAFSASTAPGVPALLGSLAVLIVAAAGWMDDHGGAPVRLRILVHLGAGLLLLPLVSPAPLPAILAPLAAGWWVFWTVSAINVVNFMDGIDGIIGLQGFVFGVYCVLATADGGNSQLLGLALAGSSAGFLLWNWSPARIFMGDVGSGALGVLFVLTGAMLAREGRVDFIAAFAPLSPIFLDAAVTLVRRARRGERLSVAHRSHLYQRLANGGVGHARVTLGYGVAAASCAAIATLMPTGGLGLLALLVGACASAAWAAEAWLRRSGEAVLS